MGLLDVGTVDELRRVAAVAHLARGQRLDVITTDELHRAVKSRRGQRLDVAQCEASGSTPAAVDELRRVGVSSVCPWPAARRGPARRRRRGRAAAR